MEYLDPLFSPKNNKVLIIGIGNYLRSDDGAGPKIIDRLIGSPKVSLLNAETNIERYIEPIRNSNASVLLFIDSMSFGKNPGYCSLVPVDEIIDFSFHSHNISINRLRDFFHVPAYILGIEPETLRVGEDLSPLVQQTVNMIVEYLNKLIRDFR
jgi:hydrogenase 3 maturation protease